jgi:hypothetical protein
MQEKCLNELLRNETFINYCLKRNEQDVSDWETRIEQRPEIKSQLEELKVLVLAMGHHAGQKAVEQNYMKLRALINKGYKMKKRYILFFFSWISTAAAIIVLPVIFVFYSLTNESLHIPADHPENSLIYSAKYRPGDYVSSSQVRAIM